MDVPRLSALLPPQPPTRMDLFAAVLCLIGLVTGYFPTQEPGSRIAWPVAVTAFVFGVLVAGPGERSSLGRSFKQWADSIGPGGRLLVVGGAIAAVVVAFLALPIPERVANGLVVGLLLNVVVTVSVNYLHAKTVGRSNAA